MRLLPRDEAKILLHQVTEISQLLHRTIENSLHLRLKAGFLAQKRLARGLRLNQTEATALIASQLQERIRDGAHSVAELRDLGKRILGRKHVLPGVPATLRDIQVEGTFHDG